jgi:hypothetical protein
MKNVVFLWIFRFSHPILAATRCNHFGFIGGYDMCSCSSVG